jgi:hypothetical protein
VTERDDAPKRLRLLPHWIAWPLMLLGLWYLALPLGGYWSAYGLGLVAAVGLGVWSRRAFRVAVLGQPKGGVVLRIDRVRRRVGRRRKVLRLGIAAVVALFALNAVANQLVAKPRAAAEREASVPPNLNDSGPLPTIAGPSGDSRVEPTLTHVASLISGARTEVRCWSVADWRQREAEWGNWRGRRLGLWGAYTTPWRPWIRNAYRIHLSPSICASLARLAYEDVPVQKDPWPEALAWSVAALAHESKHASGIFEEATAECYGVQSISATAQALGRSSAEGQYLASRYWRDAYLKQRDPAYRSDECRNGGELDLQPRTDIWP